MLNAPLSVSTVDLSFADDDWPSNATFYRAASVGNSWGVTSIGRGFDWKPREREAIAEATDHSYDTSQLFFSAPSPDLSNSDSDRFFFSDPSVTKRSANPSSPRMSHPSSPAISRRSSLVSNTAVINLTTDPASYSPIESPIPSRPLTPISGRTSPDTSSITFSRRNSRASSSRSRPRRRSSQQRVSLIAGRVSIAQVEPPSPPPATTRLVRSNSATSFISVASVGAPTPNSEPNAFLAERSISEFVVEREIGRGAYGLVKRAREMQLDGTSGPPVIIKQVIKSRILADCWKRHPKYGTIPVEIYVMSSISATSFTLPVRRPWDPTRLLEPGIENPHDYWVEGSQVKGHPNICPLLDFFEDVNYYYLVMPCITPIDMKPAPPSDLFELVEGYPEGLPPHMVRTYLGQIADALYFLHSQGIVHRDIKDENVILGPGGRCLLIDFGSSGLVKKSGWDTFSGTLDYAGPEILRGERYFGKEQDVWAFGVVAYVMIVGECPFLNAAEAQEGLDSPFSNASMALDDHCADDKEQEGVEEDGGGALGDAAALVRACLALDVAARPTFEKILDARFLRGTGGW